MKINRIFLYIALILGIFFVIFAFVPSHITSGFNNPMTVINPPKTDYSYSFVHLSDPQTLTTAYPSTLRLTFSEIESLKSQYNISAIFITGDLTNEYDGGPGDGHDFARYAQAVTLTTIHVYEIAGNHDVPTIGDYTAWDTYVPSGSTKHNYDFVFNDFIVYGFGWSGETSVDPTAKIAMERATAQNPTKVPLIMTHDYFTMDNWMSGERDPIAYDILNALTRDSVIMSGHRHNSEQNGYIGQNVYHNLTFIEDLINYQDWDDFSGGRLYSVTSNGTQIKRLQISDLYLYPDFVVNDTVSYTPPLWNSTA